MPATVKVDVAIVGGGPGGLAAANAIRGVRRDLNVRVCERSSAMRRQGNLFSLFPNGKSALAAINPKIAERLRESVIDFTGVRVDDFTTVVEKPPMHIAMSEALGIDAGEIMLLAWYLIRDTLASFLPEETIQLGYALDSVTLKDSGTAQLTFSNKDEVVDAKIVIGCDGNKSVVRNCIINDGDPIETKSVVARGIVDAPRDWPYPKGALTTIRPEGLEGVMLLCYLVKGEDIVGWNCALNDPVGIGGGARAYIGDRDSVNAQEKARLLDILEPWRQDIRELVEITPLDQFTVHRLTYREAKDNTKWGKGCITLLGDAAHLATPSLGQGVSMAVEDAVELGRAIGELGPTEAALRKYEQVRMPRTAKVHEGSLMVFRKIAPKDNAPPMSELDWHVANSWCATATFDPLVPAKAPSVS